MDPIFTTILALALAFTMWGLGLSLKLSDFKQVFVQPKPILLGLINQLVMLPLIAFGLISFLDMSPEIAVGLMIISACPGGPSSNLLNYLAKADTALSISLTAITSVLSVITVPFIVNFALKRFASSDAVELDVVAMSLKLMVLVLVPLAIGMIVYHYKPALSEKMAKPMRIASGLVLAFIIVMIVISERDNIVSYIKQAGVVALALNVFTMVLGIAAAKLAKLPSKQGLTIALDTGIQNGTMALTIAGTILLNTAYGITAAVYSLFMYFSAALIIYIFKDKS